MHTNTSLAAIWSQVTSLLEGGFSLIPVRDKKDSNGAAKSPYQYWKRFQKEIVSPAELWDAMAEKYNTTAVAVICGAVSGNLEAIDIDIKWYPGIDAILFKAIQDLYPNLWARLRIHRSPSGGYHILYRIIDGPPPPNKHLAKRATTKEDNTDAKAVAYIETRGEGGYVLLPPSMGYSIFKPEPVPHITRAERDSLIGLCESFSQLVKVDKQVRLTKKESDYYDENPFEHFNRSDAGRNVLLEMGWQPNGESSQFAWFTKPKSQSGERHASYIKKKQMFYFWTTATEFEDGRCYWPSTVLAILRFGGDNKATYQELVNRGFGRIKASREAKLVRSAKTAPPNLSPVAQEQFLARTRERTEAHPYGIFWELAGEESDRINIDREALYTVSGGLGFRLYGQEVVRLIAPGFIEKVTERTYYDTVKAYIKETDADLYQDIVNTYEHFLQVAGQFTITRLPLLDESLIMSDTVTHCYKFFRDCWIKITANSVETFQYDELPGYVWRERILDRDYVVGETGRYIDFLDKAVEYNKMKEHVLRVIGYLAHEYKDETTPFIITMTEQCPDPRMGGGSGKNLFCNLFNQITTVATRPGEQIKYDEKFFQTWNGQKLFVVSDAPKDFNFLFLKELTSGSAVLKKLWKNEEEITVERLPKIIVNTNYSYEITDGGLKRRIIPLEFTEFFTRNKGVRTYYGAHFPRGWTEEDWAGYNHVMIAGIQAWLDSDLVLEPPSLTVGGWRKQFEQTYGHSAVEFIYENFDVWVSNGFVPNSMFKEELHAYCEEKGINKIYQPSINKVNKALEDYCARMNVVYEADVQRKVMGTNMKCKVFNKQQEEENPF